MPNKKLKSIKLQVNDKQRELAAQKSLVGSDIYRIKYRSKELASRPASLAISFFSGLCLGLLGTRSTIRPLADGVMATSVKLTKNLVIVPLIGQYLLKNFQRKQND